MARAEWFAFYFAVTGMGEFPVDMLRYDCCHPATERDSHKVERSSEARTVILRGYRKEARMLVTPARWQSFGWDVTEGPAREAYEVSVPEGDEA